MRSTAPIAVSEPVPPLRPVPEKARGRLAVSAERAEAQPGQQRSHYHDWSPVFNPAVPADCAKEQIEEQQSRALPP